MAKSGRRRIEDRDPYVESVAAVVRAEAARAGLRAHQVAKIMNIAPSTVSAKMRGINNFSVSDIARFARHLGLTPGELMDNIDVPMSVRTERLMRLAEAAQAQQEETGAASTSHQEEEPSDEDSG
ncbi:MAG TPA: helix-turn-helix transcriptional regulator, partial [Beutenbergiaceae bacterium]|nr:helix-turn-helix transcriptional regulator [Beutenbergiaceae bacterium]